MENAETWSRNIDSIAGKVTNLIVDINGYLNLYKAMVKVNSQLSKPNDSTRLLIKSFLHLLNHDAQSICQKVVAII